MFTGIIEEIGTVYEVRSVGGNIRFVIEAPRMVRELNVNDSVSVNGVCQTVVEKESTRFAVVAVEETLSKTTMGSFTSGSRVNIELPLKADGRLGGHIVLGHVDCVGEIESIVSRDGSWIFGISIPGLFKKYVIPVGSISIDGVSLTVASLDANIAFVSIIPHTMENTIFSLYGIKTRVNLEFDLIGKYVERLLGMGWLEKPDDTISSEQLKAWGYDV